MTEVGEPTYLVDTCVWVNIRDVHQDSEKIWSQVLLVVELDRIKTVRQVFEELENRFPDVHARLKPYRSQVLVPDGILYGADAIAEMRAIQKHHPKLIDPLGGGNPADPFLIAAGKVTGGIVVTDERSAGKGHKDKIPYVCTQRNVGWANRLNFFEALGIGL